MAAGGRVCSLTTVHCGTTGEALGSSYSYNGVFISETPT